MEKGYLVGTQSEVWKAGEAQQITFIVAELVRGIATRPVKEHVLQHVVMAAIPVMHRDLSYK